MYMTWRLYVLDQLLTLNILYYSAMLSKEMVYIWDTQCTEWRYTFTNETWLFQTLPHFYTWILKMQWTAENIISVQNSLYKQVDNLLIVSERYYRTKRAKTIDYHLLNQFVHVVASLMTGEARSYIHARSHLKENLNIYWLKQWWEIPSPTRQNWFS